MPGNPGRMNRRLTIEVRTLTKDSAGGRSESWGSDFKAWAEQLKSKEVERVVAESDRSEDSRHWRVRWRSDIDPRTHRVSYAGAKFQIVGMTEEGIKDHLVLSCRNVEGLEA